MNTDKNTEKLICEGSCEQCRGDVRRVKVSSVKFLAPWYFNYCQDAIDTDERDGFTVEVLSDETSATPSPLKKQT